MIYVKIFYELCDYFSQFNPLSKCIMKIATALVFILLIAAMYFAMAAGRIEEYYISMYYFEILIDNAKSVFGLGCFFALLIEPVLKKYVITD